MEISKIPDDELKNDLRDSLEDIETCTLALMAGVTRYSGGSVSDRLAANLLIAGKIKDELLRRGYVIKE
jgi:hypothetical protein